MFKVGDKVRVIEGVTAGDVGTVIKCDGKNFIVLIGGYKYLYYETELQRV